jgi:hypothetical protein
MGTHPPKLIFEEILPEKTIRNHYVLDALALQYSSTPLPSLVTSGIPGPVGYSLNDRNQTMTLLNIINRPTMFCSASILIHIAHGSAFAGAETINHHKIISVASPLRAALTSPFDNNPPGIPLQEGQEVLIDGIKAIFYGCRSTSSECRYSCVDRRYIWIRDGRLCPTWDETHIACFCQPAGIH